MKKFMTAITISAAIGVFTIGLTSAGAADRGPSSEDAVNSSWYQMDKKGVYIAFTNGTDWVNVYKYDINDELPEISLPNKNAEACYQTFYAQGDTVYAVFGEAVYAEDITEVRAMVENICYPGNPAIEDAQSYSEENRLVNMESTSTGTDSETDNDDTAETNSESGTDSSISTDSDTDTDYGNGRSLSILGGDGSIVVIYGNAGGTYCDDYGVTYQYNGDDTWQDEYGKSYTILDDETHYFGTKLETHTLESESGEYITVTQTTNGDYFYRDSNGTGFTDNGDGTWSGENGEIYTQID